MYGVRVPQMCIVLLGGSTGSKNFEKYLLAGKYRVWWQGNR
jgi:hypothetical protein